MNTERIKRLKNVLLTIEANEGFENSFDKLYQLIQEEYHLEGGITAEYLMGSYNHDLSLTIKNQANSYIMAKKKKPIKGAPYEFNIFVSNFKQDVTNALGDFRFK